MCTDICSKPGVCGKGAICKANNSKAECSCPIGHRGNPHIECSIRKVFTFEKNVYWYNLNNLGDSCLTNNDCPGNLHCLGNYCGCPSPFHQESSFCISNF